MPNAIDKIRSLCSQYKNHFGVSLTEVEQNPPKGFELEQLDSYSSSDGLSHHLSRLLACLPHEVVANELGRDALIWSWAKYKGEGSIESDLALSVSKLPGIDIELLNQARSITRRFSHRLSIETKTSSIIKTYNLMNGLCDAVKEAKTINGPLPEAYLTKEHFTDMIKLLKI